MIKLNNAGLEQIAQKVGIPNYGRENLKSGIVHMSIGGFHRAHQAFYIDKLLADSPENWMITAVGLLPSDEQNIATLNTQDCLYTLVQRSAEEDVPRVIGSIKHAIHAPSDPQEVLKVLAAESTKIVSLTVTEKGYCYDQTGNLDQTNHHVSQDLQNLDSPKTVLGYLVASLQVRKNNDLNPFTIMSCDNLPGNGHLTHKLVMQFAELVDVELAKWIDETVKFPNAMVDRITPATDDSTLELVKKYQIDDAWPVACEDYVQWVLEDDFVNDDRPALEQVGVQLVEDVEPYEKMKVRLLNGSHSALAYISYLIGYRKVDDAMADQQIADFVRRYMDEDITPSVPDVPGIDLDEYKDSLIVRFANPAISDQIQRLAEDGSTKIPNAILPCIKYQLENGGSIKYACLALAAWFSYLRGVDEKLEPIDVNDPMAERFKTAMQLDSNTSKNILAISEVFGTELPANEEFVNQLDQALQSISSKGAKVALETYLSDPN